MRKRYLIPAVILIGLLLLLAGGAFDSVKRGAGFLIIPSFTPSATNTLTPSATFTSTATDEPTATFTLTPTFTPTVTMTPEPTATHTAVPSDTPTPLPTFDETAFAESFYAEMTASAEIYMLMQTPSATPVIPDHELYTGLRTINPVDGKDLIFIRNSSVKGSIGLWIAWNEVTNAEYRSCIYDGGCTSPMSYRCAGEKYYFEDDAYDNYPVVNVTRKQAVDYCTWAGMRLMTLTDWRIAADMFEGEGSNYDMIAAQPLKVSPDAPYYFGNVWEWTVDNETSGKGIITGGSWKTSVQDIRGKRVAALEADRFAEDLGFRCVTYVY